MTFSDEVEQHYLVWWIVVVQGVSFIWNKHIVLNEQLHTYYLSRKHIQYAAAMIHKRPVISGHTAPGQ